MRRASRSPSKPGVWAVSSRKPSGSSRPATVVRSAGRSSSMRQSPATRPMPVARWVEDDPGVASPAPDLTLAERQRIVDDPADGPVGEAGEAGVAPRPRHRRAGGVHVRDRSARGGQRERREPGVGEEVETRLDRPSRRGSPTRSRSHGSIAACSGKSPTWPASVARSSSVTSSTSIGQGSSATAGPLQPRRGRSAGRLAPGAGFGPRAECPRATAGRRGARRTVRAGRHRQIDQPVVYVRLSTSGRLVGRVEPIQGRGRSLDSAGPTAT